ncbi:MAG: hypothetical protein EB127_14150 [Alphaproteobacteria bacterium]|nr:hypothetical protein [Alphaproteobacteria bacterium]
MGLCLAKTAYTMTAEIYSASVSQDSTGAVVKTWALEKEIPCVVRGILRKGVGDNSISVSLQDYLNVFTSTLKMRSGSPILTSKRIVNISNSDGVIFVENQDPASEGGFNGSTIFEPRGSTPIMNFDGSVIEYETVLVRQEIQRLTT